MSGPGERPTPKQSSDVLPPCRAAVVHHARTLRAAGLLQPVGKGRDLCITVDQPTLIEALRLTLDHVEATS